MKSSLTPSERSAARSRFIPLAALAASFLTIGFVGCSKDTRADATATAKDAYADTKAAFAKGWDDVKSFTFDQRDKFSANAKALSAKMDSEVSEVRAN